MRISGSWTPHGDRKLLVSGELLTCHVPENASAPTQATGLGRHAPADYQWAPDGTALLFQGPNALVWFELKSKTPRTLVSGKQILADPKISPDSKFVSFVRDHNLWLVKYCGWQRAARNTRRSGRRSQRRTGLGISGRIGHQDGLLVGAGFFSYRVSGNG